MLRGMTSFLAAFYTFLTIFALAALASDSAQQWNKFLGSQRNPAMVAFHAFALLYFLSYQTFPWFKLAPKAMPVQVGEKQLPGEVIVIAHYVTWILISVFIYWLVGVI
jgi:fumarate reductase subunit C